MNQNIMYYRVTKKDGEKVEFTATFAIRSAVRKLMVSGRGDFQSRCDALTSFLGFPVVDWELNDYPLESNSVCSKCGGEMAGPKSLCCEAPATTPSAFRNKIPAAGCSSQDR